MEETFTDPLALLRTRFPGHQIGRTGACILGALDSDYWDLLWGHHPALQSTVSWSVWEWGLSDTFQQGQDLIPQPTAAPCPLRGVDAG